MPHGVDVRVSLEHRFPPYLGLDPYVHLCFSDNDADAVRLLELPGVGVTDIQGIQNLGELEEVMYNDHWSWIYTLRNNPEAADGTHIWERALNAAPQLLEDVKNLLQKKEGMGQGQ